MKTFALSAALRGAAAAALVALIAMPAAAQSNAEKAALEAADAMVEAQQQSGKHQPARQPHLGSMVDKYTEAMGAPVQPGQANPGQANPAQAQRPALNSYPYGREAANWGAWYRTAPMPGYPYGAVVWVPGSAASPMPYGQQAAAAPAANAKPNAKAKPGKTASGRPQPILCMVATAANIPNMPSRIAVIANSVEDCTAIGGSASQTAARK